MVKVFFLLSLPSPTPRKDVEKLFFCACSETSESKNYSTILYCNCNCTIWQQLSLSKTAMLVKERTKKSVVSTVQSRHTKKERPTMASKKKNKFTTCNPFFLPHVILVFFLAKERQEKKSLWVRSRWHERAEKSARGINIVCFFFPCYNKAASRSKREGKK